MLVVTMSEPDANSTQSTSTGMWCGWGWGEEGSGVGDSVRAQHQLSTEYIHWCVVGMGL